MQKLLSICVIALIFIAHATAFQPVINPHHGSGSTGRSLASARSRSSNILRQPVVSTPQTVTDMSVSDLVENTELLAKLSDTQVFGILGAALFTGGIALAFGKSLRDFFDEY
ncbi:unnamed protein product [Vitrella brassicaformis CCMP3155]|uniref:Uncharacterized protein n=1 Tax=Vitrella brassicaformis (strain CCMP3155) TaxID=1169540 RepID=A0A0G4H259_VITBC|nr:unnamed protein product [Vitrella brassicaformis CCMP3155]|mmetsp:Transcript_16100/g.48730  ORF Transcript_16100/g.48730 Transcript_16100/m.48730 type:complete len:112 (-) Transcript_16100:104-439(-)|eukprot:CEM37620.1 unnamed protein product [Vitrella brassicaformis CCMP3155]